ncbi:class I SAM-dependent methyltransferase [Metabacillus sediminilitoris]|uniref:class I SAM-dependent methyltransferase n=1 Tax=Metabacillus sediminilitoris TaxID=2567941 RepID=UPI001454E012|nr:class I SAM-dependent methyltransferase [Metabacillus sediminilitoris]
MTEHEIKSGSHRLYVGGNWEIIGKLQFDFLVKQGLLPNHQLLDVGCGSLRGGIHFIKYLKSGNYYGMDINSSLIKAGKFELKRANLVHKQPNLLVDDTFSFKKFNQEFDFAIAHSLFTHLPLNVIKDCLLNMEKVLKKEGTFFATFFESKEKNNKKPIKQSSGIITYPNKNPYHYQLFDFDRLIKGSSLELKYIGNWGHSRNQKMLCFKKKSP